MNYEKLLLDELRVVVYEEGTQPLTEDLLVKAVTLNENLTTLGYILAPADVVSLAVSPSLDNFYNHVESLMDREIPAKPMYPGFPKQVMELDEAVLRFHQLVHYFSTYGMELVFGVEVQHGWLPFENEKETEKAPQPRILSAKTIGLLKKEDAYLVPLKRILVKRERMTLPEKELIGEAILHVKPEDFQDFHVGFKENLKDLYIILFQLEQKEVSFAMLRALCQHTGDVLECISILLGKNKFHFRTSQKRFLVNLIESYTPQDLRANLILSNKGAEANFILLNYLDYSIYSKSSQHMDVVKDFRDGKLRSFESTFKTLLAKGDQGALDFIATRPGMMLRMIAWLMRLGYSEADILEKLMPHIASLSMQTIVTTLNHFSRLTNEERPDAEAVQAIFKKLILEHMKTLKTPLFGKKVCFQMDDYDLEASTVQCSNKSLEGGYIQSGIAYRIPKDVERIRFFVYWNDSQRVDIDLHARFNKLGEEEHLSLVGWDADYKNSGVVFSGDITHSNAAEYIDIDLTQPLHQIHANINLYYGRDYFKDVETCFVGMMAVPENPGNEPQALYSAPNCFFFHHLRQSCSTMHYGYIDVPRRCIIFEGGPTKPLEWYATSDHFYDQQFSLKKYLALLCEAQQVTLCEDPEEADTILVMGKPNSEKELSLIDANYFMS